MLRVGSSMRALRGARAFSTAGSEKIAMVGSGNFGSALVRILGQNTTRHAVFDDEVRMYVHEEMVDGKPLTEIVASVDFDAVEHEQVFDPNSSLKVSMGLPPVETARGRIDLIMDVVNGKVDMKSDPAEEHFYKAYTISYRSMDKYDAKQWLGAQFGE